MTLGRLQAIRRRAEPTIRSHERHAQALSTGAMEQPSRQWRDHHEANAGRAGRLSEQRHVRWIATKSCDVRVNPAQRRDLIEQSVISGDLVL